MHAFLTGIFEGVVLGIAIVLLLASLEMRKAAQNRDAFNEDGFESGPTSPS